MVCKGRLQDAWRNPSNNPGPNFPNPEFSGSAKMFFLGKKLVMDKHMLQGLPKTKQPGSNCPKDEK